MFIFTLLLLSHKYFDPAIVAVNISKTNRDMKKSQWQCVGDVHSCRALCGKSGLYVSLAEYLNSCIGSESSERFCFHLLPLLFSVVSWSSPTHLLFPPLGKAVSAYSIFGVEYRLCFISLFCSIFVFLKILSVVFSVSDTIIYIHTDGVRDWHLYLLTVWHSNWSFFLKPRFKSVCHAVIHLL